MRRTSISRPSFAIEKLLATFLQRQNVNDCNAQLTLRHQKIGQRLLLFGIDLHQDDVLRIVTGDDQLTHQLPVRIMIVTAEINAEIARQIVRLDVLLMPRAVDIRKGKETPAARRVSAPARRSSCALVRSLPAQTWDAALDWARCIGEEQTRRRRGGTADYRPVAKLIRGRTAPSDREGTWEQSTASRRRESRCACRRLRPTQRETGWYFSGEYLRLNSSRSAGTMLRPR